MSFESQLIELNCAVLGGNSNHAFTIDIAHNENVSALKPRIKEITQMNDIPDGSIQLYRINLSGWMWTPLDDFTDMLRSAMPKEPLEPTDALCKIYPPGSPLDNRNLHIVVVVPEYVMGGADLFRTDDIQDILGELGYELTSDSLSNPFVAAVSSVADSSETGFLKFIRTGGQEIPILQHISAINSPRNPTVPGIRFWPVREGHVISMRSAGLPLTDLTNPSAQLWSAARQLFEAVDFLHHHGVAHLDLKPDNVLIPPSGGRLSIIDFGTSVRIKGVDSTFCGVVGTRGYIPPEVDTERGEFSAVRADLWSCGRTLQELCIHSKSTAECGVLFEIVDDLMDSDPERRPMMYEVLERMTEHEIGWNAGMGLRFSCASLSELLANSDWIPVKPHAELAS